MGECPFNYDRRIFWICRVSDLLSDKTLSFRRDSQVTLFEFGDGRESSLPDIAKHEVNNPGPYSFFWKEHIERSQPKNI